MYATLDALRSDLGRAEQSPVSEAYAAKMLHPVPSADSVNRVEFVLARVAGKRVLEFGASGLLHDGIVKAAAYTVGVDRTGLPYVVPSAYIPDDPVPASGDVFAFDLDDVTQHALPVMDAPDLILCGELLEHLSNPGWFLARLRRQYPDVPVLITVPNAFSTAARKSILTGVEQVNKDHVAWLSWKTLTTLLTRAGFTVAEFVWYGGPPYVAEGLIVVTEAQHGDR